MGMAASQARLLSITTRLSDNELRAQLINNAKMRLTTESAQASDAYVKALNETQYMFTNYDENNKASYQNLTFNALTKYNEFNTQYGLSTSAGQLLVSELDAKRFQSSGGDLSKFLKSYGIEYQTSYFTNLKLHESSGKVQLGNTVNSAGITTTNYSPYSASTLQQMYEGTGTGYAGYENSLLTSQFNQYTKLAGEYNESKTAYNAIIKDVMVEYLDGLSCGHGTTLKMIKEFVSGASSEGGSYDQAINYFHEFDEILDTLNSSGKLTSSPIFEGKSFYNYINDMISNSTYIDDRYRTTAVIGSYTKTGDWVEATDTTPGHYENMKSILNIPCRNGATTICITKDLSTGGYSSKVLEGGEEMPAGDYRIKTEGSSYIVEFYSEGSLAETYSFNGFDGTWATGSDWDSLPNGNTDTMTYKDTLQNTYNKQVYYDNLYIILNIFNDSVIKGLDHSKFDDIAETSPEYSSIYNNYVAASRNMSNFIFGYDVGFSDYQNLDDYTWVVTRGSYSSNYNAVRDVLALEDVISIYGEPKYAYIKDSDPDSNADAEAEWYTNLFNRMTKGYKVLEDGLANSTEWIAYALESGLVAMEQVDKKQNWNSITYTSCSDITEQTKNNAVTIAEAEYNKAMNKIENKDKAYDAELKNIDTEHTALQTEYDSIKSALDKNVERNFKLYS